MFGQRVVMLCCCMLWLHALYLHMSTHNEIHQRTTSQDLVMSRMVLPVHIPIGKSFGFMIETEQEKETLHSVSA